MKTQIQKGDRVKCINNRPLSKTGIGPKLESGKVYEVKSILSIGEHDHIDVGLPMDIGFVRCLESKPEIFLAEQDIDEKPRIHPHWCHPSRFVVVG